MVANPVVICMAPYLLTPSVVKLLEFYDPCGAQPGILVACVGNP
jgi:hypothetical protein